MPETEFELELTAAEMSDMATTPDRDEGMKTGWSKLRTFARRERFSILPRAPRDFSISFAVVVAQAPA